VKNFCQRSNPRRPSGYKMVYTTDGHFVSGVPEGGRKFPLGVRILLSWPVVNEVGAGDRRKWPRGFLEVKCTRLSNAQCLRQKEPIGRRTSGVTDQRKIEIRWGGDAFRKGDCQSVDFSCKREGRGPSSVPLEE